MIHRNLSLALVLGLAAVASTWTAVAAPAASADRHTLTGMSKAVGATSGKMDPAVANATLTVSHGNNGSDEVYEVYGWGGIIMATQANGKKVEVTGTVSVKAGKKTITAASVGVKIIVVDDSTPKKSADGK